MDRRDFLRGAIGASLAFGLVALAPAVQTGTASAQANDTLPRFRGSSDGRIFELSGDDATWLPRANFGEHCAIPEVSERDGRVYARVVVQGHAFIVQSPDGRKWYTLGVLQRA